MEADADETLLAWILFFLALHDLGKLHALFQVKAPHAVALAWPDFDSNLVKCRDAGAYSHGHEGFRLVKQGLASWLSLDKRDARRLWRCWRPWLAAVAGHHGDLPGEQQEGPPPRGYAERSLVDIDADARLAWVEKAAELFLEPVGLTLAECPPPCDLAAQGLLAGFCSLCDWIGSNADYFSYTPWGIDEAAYLKDRSQQIAAQELLRHFGLVAETRPFTGLPTLLRKNERPRGIQVLIEDLPISAGLTVIEAPTGSGKTEAALAHAWRLLEAGLADSIVFALPTQATANAMLSRADRFGQQAFGSASLVLAHGNRALNPEFRRLVEAGRHGSAQGREEASIQCAAWLASSRKKVFLGQIGVCTVDQTLLSVLPVRHNFVRQLGLNRSVLIVDEVHAYDAYMNGLLTEVLRRQRATGGNAILLSATLPAGVRKELLQAWGADDDPEPPYPALCTVHGGRSETLGVSEEHRPPQRTVAIQLEKAPGAFPGSEIVDRMIEGAAEGAQIGVVMNTVDDAQRLYRVLQERSGEKRIDLGVDLFHARFRLRDRQAIEQGVIERYGREGAREAGRILVATQVVEQSLDLDFDWLVSQLCPVDLLFQRLGRLHRHDRPRSTGFAEPACTVLCPDEGDYGVHKLIYGDPRLLWRTEQLLGEHGRISFPEAYRDWIENVYAENPWEKEPDAIYGEHLAWREDRHAAAERARQLTTMTVSQFRDDDERATGLTRDGEMSLTVLPLLEDGRLLDGTDPKSLEEHERAEGLVLGSVPAPRSWQGALKANATDDDGRVRVLMEPLGPGCWASACGECRYSLQYGLEKTATTDQDDPPHGRPR